MKGRGALAPAQRQQRLGDGSRAAGSGSGAPAEVWTGGTGPVRGQLQRRDARRAAASTRRAAPPAPRPQPLALPHRVVRVLQRQLGQRRRLTRARTRCRAPPARGPARRRTSRRRRCGAGSGSSTCSSGCHAHAAARAAPGPAPDRRAGSLVLAHSRSSSASRSSADAPSAPPRAGDRPLARVDDLHGSLRGAGKVVRSTSWRRTTSSRRGLERGHVQRARQAEGGRVVVGHAARLELLQVPQPLLGEGERQRPIRGTRGMARRGSRARSARPGTRRRGAGSPGRGRRRAAGAVMRLHAPSARQAGTAAGAVERAPGLQRVGHQPAALLLLARHRPCGTPAPPRASSPTTPWGTGWPARPAPRRF